MKSSLKLVFHFSNFVHISFAMIKLLCKFQQHFQKSLCTFHLLVKSILFRWASLLKATQHSKHLTDAFTVFECHWMGGLSDWIGSGAGHTWTHANNTQDNKSDEVKRSPFMFVYVFWTVGMRVCVSWAWWIREGRCGWGQKRVMTPLFLLGLWPPS